jgi:hypothetical protein
MRSPFAASSSWKRSVLLALSLMAAGCNKDNDEDGFKSDEDCDDDNQSVSPVGYEICDGLDNDCDGDIDEGLSSYWYPDADDDGYGDGAAELIDSCSQPGGYVDNQLDCDDGNNLRFPGAPEKDCGDLTDYNCDGLAPFEDGDGDTVLGCDDCDDGDASRAPGLSEVCDGIDNDCDLSVDEEPDPADAATQTYYIDYDRDSFGSDDYVVVACESPDVELFVDNADDCNDLSDQSRPDGTEICDGLDNDCDGAFDADDDSVIDAGLYYLDGDSDGYGDPDSLDVACVFLEGFVEIGDDCDDTSGDVNPDVLEICNDGVDNDCDSASTCELTAGSSDGVILGAATTDNLGRNITNVGDINGDGQGDIVVSADNADPNADGNREGAVYLFYGPISSTFGTLSASDADVSWRGEATSDQAGVTLAALGDVDGDGIDDIAIGASQNTYSTKTKSGAVYLVSGADVPSSGTVALSGLPKFYGNKTFDYLGGGVNGVGDLNGDGIDDFAAGASLAESASTSASQGGVYLFWGDTTLGSATATASTTADVVLYGEVASDRLGLVIERGGDIDGDGRDDLLLGTKYNGDGGANAGAVYIGLDLATFATGGTVDGLDVQMMGGSASDSAGSAISPAGDTNADGYADFWVAAPGDNTAGGSSSGSVYLVGGAADPVTTLDGVSFEAVALAQIHGHGSDDAIGNAIAGNGDLNGDADNDILIGATAAGAAGEGVTYIVYGPVSGVNDVEAVMVGLVRGTDTDDSLGSDVSFLGDLDASGNDDVGISAVNANQAATDAGAAYILFGVGL